MLAGGWRGRGSSSLDRRGFLVTRTRRERRPERKAALGRLARAVVAAAVAVAILRYGSRVDMLAAHVVEAARVARAVHVAKIAAVWAAGIALFNLGAASGRCARWLTALRQERMLRDPRRAALVPPRGEHLACLEGNVRAGGAPIFFLIFGVFLLAMGLGLAKLDMWLGSAKEGGGGGSTRLYPVYLLLAGVLALLGGVADLRGWSLLRRVERMSKRPAPGDGPAPEPSSGRAARIPLLEVRFQAPTPHPSRGLQVTTERNVFGRPPWDLAYLRLFDNQARLEEMLSSTWRECGYVHLIRSAASVGRAELNAAKDGRQLFIRSRDQLLAELCAQPPEPVPVEQPRLTRWQRWSVLQAEAAKRGNRLTGAERQQLLRQHRAETRGPRFRRVYPVRSLLCHDSFWKSALDVLLERVDVVVLDLSGYQRKNLGTGYELQRVVDRFPIRRCIVLADPLSDEEFLDAQIRQAWSRMADGSPNAGERPRSVLVARTGRRARSAQASSPGGALDSGPGTPAGDGSWQETLSLAAILQRRLDGPGATER